MKNKSQISNLKFQISNLKLKSKNKLSAKRYLLNANFGFTLIELLVVISIISILAAFLMANFIGIRQRGRDALRKSDLKQIQSAMELYRADNGKYPGLTTNNVPGWTFASNLFGIEPNYMQKIPSDPTTGDACPGYLVVVDGAFSKYTIFVVLENKNDFDATRAKQAPSASPGGSVGAGNKTFTSSNGGTCGTTAYNFWVNNP